MSGGRSSRDKKGGVTITLSTILRKGIKDARGRDTHSRRRQRQPGGYRHEGQLSPREGPQAQSLRGVPLPRSEAPSAEAEQREASVARVLGRLLHQPRLPGGDILRGGP